MNNNIIELKNVSIGYVKSKTREYLLKNINIELLKNEFTCLMGANGVGKSTLLRVISGLKHPIDGTIIINGITASNKPSFNLSKLISIVLTNDINTHNLKVKELVAMGRYPTLGWRMKLTDHDKYMIQKAIELTNLKQIENDKIHQLSDGQKKITLIARAICQNTPIIILDEPTTFLDINNRLEIINLLKNLVKNEKKTILLATHDINLTLNFADRIWIINNNKKLVSGYPEDLILDNVLDTVFKPNHYNIKTTLNKVITYKKKVNLIGKDFYYYWTRNALERNEYSLCKNAQTTIHILKNKNWEITKNGKNLSVKSIEELIKTLDNLI